jgi:hypothetical protein
MCPHQGGPTGTPHRTDAVTRRGVGIDILLDLDEEL